MKGIDCLKSHTLCTHGMSKDDKHNTNRLCVSNRQITAIRYILRFTAHFFNLFKTRSRI